MICFGYEGSNRHDGDLSSPSPRTATVSDPDRVYRLRRKSSQNIARRATSDGGLCMHAGDRAAGRCSFRKKTWRTSASALLANLDEFWSKGPDGKLCCLSVAKEALVARDAGVERARREGTGGGERREGNKKDA